MFCCSSKRLLFLVLLGLAMIFGLAYLFQWQIILGYAPFLLILLCPLMHLFGGHGNHQTGPETPRTDKKEVSSCH